MMKKLILPIFACYLLTHVGCTSSDVQDKSDVAVSDDESFSEEAEGDFADGSESSGDDASTSEETQEEVADEGSGEETTEQEGEQVAEEDTGAEDGGDEMADAETETEDGTGEEVAQNDELGDEFADGDEESEFPDEIADETEPTDETAVASNQPSDESLFTDSGTSNNDMAAPVDPAPPADETVAANNSTDDVFNASGGGGGGSGSYSPLQKIRSTPFESGGGNLNRVYLTRKGDTWKSVSEKIYGSDRSDDLKHWNSFNVSHGRELRTGEKVYYNSPKSPTDKSQMLTYYEEMGIPPQTYTSADGDNIRDVSEKLLGARDSWKELWSTNASVESRGALPAGLELRYWPEVAGGAPVGTMASNNPPPDAAPPMPETNPNLDPTATAGVSPAQPDPTMMPPIEDPTATGANPAPPSDVAANDPLSQPIDTSPPPVDTSAPPPIAGSTDGQPPADGGIPSPDPVKKKAPATAEASPTGDADTTMMVGIAGVALLLLVGVIVIMRKNRSRRIDLSQTQV